MEKYIFFWKPKFNVVSTCLTQWYIAPFIADGVEYKCAEQYMMAQKAILFGDTNTLKLIMKTSDPSEMKKLGRMISNFNADMWDSHKEKIVLRGNIAKFSDPRNIRLKEYLLSTKGKTLVEASPYDKIWGIGMDAQTAMNVSPEQWNGQNLLGKILMLVREELSK